MTSTSFLYNSFYDLSVKKKKMKLIVLQWKNVKDINHQEAIAPKLNVFNSISVNYVIQKNVIQDINKRYRI